jgi:glycosyltransferase involved in cell wall biosynthesis
VNKSICIVSFSPVHRDARVLRQVEYLSKCASITVIGYGQLDSFAETGVSMYSIQPANGNGLMRKVRTLVLLPLGRILPGWAYEAWYWGRSNHQTALARSLESNASVFHANDWNSLPVAVKVSEKTGARIVLDLHEYAPLQSEERWHWRLFVRPMIEYFLRKYASHASVTITVNEAIANRYAEEYNLRPIVIMNSPQYIKTLRPRQTEPNHIRLIHHGSAMRDRRLELMIQAIAYTDSRYTLHFMLAESSQEYTSWLRTLAQRLAPGRVFFHQPVQPSQVVKRLAEFDIGFYLLPFTNYNNMVALPNKFFDFVAAGLAVCIGPSPEMARLTRQYGCGVVTQSFDPEEVAAVLNTLTAADIDQMKNRAIRARRILNADVEMAKLTNLYSELLHSGRQ